MRLNRHAVSYVACCYTLVESLTGFLNRLDYPTRGLIYKNLLTYAFNKALLGETIMVEPYVRAISSLVPDGTVFDVEAALNSASAAFPTAFPYLLESAKGEFLEYLFGI
jgi:hypothetical protein